MENDQVLCWEQMRSQVAGNQLNGAGQTVVSFLSL